MSSAITVRRSLPHVDEVMAKQVELGEITGAITAIALRGETIHFSTHGWKDVENSTPMPEDAMFRMASSTKPVTGVAVMMMVEQGLIDPEAPVYEYIPEFRGARVAVKKQSSPGSGPAAPPPPAESLEAPSLGAGISRRQKVDPADVELVKADREITVSDLLTHTSGLLSGGLGSAISEVGRDRGATLADHIPKFGSVPLDFQPGTRWAYSPGAGIDTLGRIVEIVSGQAFDEFLRSRLFQPVGMVDTFFAVPEDRQSRILPLYRKGEGGTFTNAGLRSPMSSRTYFSGSGGLVSTAADYLRFEQMLVNGGEIEGHRVLRPETVRLMATNHVGDLFVGLRDKIAGLGFGYTVQVVLDREVARSARSTGAFGWGGAFGTMTWSDPELQLAGVYMVQQPSMVARARFERAVRAAIEQL